MDLAHGNTGHDQAFPVNREEEMHHFNGVMDVMRIF